MGLLLRLALLALVAWIVFRFLQRALGLQVSVKRQGDETTSTDPQIMRRCAWCKLHVPEGESTRSGGHFFCSEAHRDAFLKKNGKP